MSKELTEKFMNDELDDRLYYFTQKMSQDNVEIGHSFAFNMVRADDGEYLDWFLIHEVLAPVPSYDEHMELVSNSAELVQKMHILEKKLDIAVKALEEYARGDSDVGNGCLYEMPASSLAQKALKEIDEVGMSGKEE